MNDTKTTGYAPGELVNVRINGVRYGTTDPGHGTRFDTADLGPSYDLGLSFWLKPGIPHTIERVAPKEWPPQPGDMWTDRDGDPWFAIKDGAVVGWRGDRMNPIDVARDCGPLTLARRDGWTPDQPSIVDPPEPDERAAFISGLRGLIDFLNAHPEVPHPDAATCQYSVMGYSRRGGSALDGPARFTEALRIAELIGSELNDNLTARLGFGGGVEYIVHTYRDTPAAAADPEPDDETSDEPMEVAP